MTWIAAAIVFHALVGLIGKVYAQREANRRNEVQKATVAALGQGFVGVQEKSNAIMAKNAEVNERFVDGTLQGDPGDEWKAQGE